MRKEKEYRDKTRNILVITTLSTMVVVILAPILFFSFSLREGMKMTSAEGYPVINGYHYRIYQPGRHQLLKPDHWPINIGTHLSQVYVDRRFIVGQVYAETSADISASDSQALRSYFVLDTLTDEYVGQLNKSEWEAKLKSIGILRDLNLRGRKHPFFLKPQRSKRFRISVFSSLLSILAVGLWHQSWRK